MHKKYTGPGMVLWPQQAHPTNQRLGRQPLPNAPFHRGLENSLVYLIARLVLGVFLQLAPLQLFGEIKQIKKIEREKERKKKRRQFVRGHALISVYVYVFSTYTYLHVHIYVHTTKYFRICPSTGVSNTPSYIS